MAALASLAVLIVHLSALTHRLLDGDEAVYVDTAGAGWSDFDHYPMTEFPVLSSIVASGYHPIANVDGVVIYERNG